MLTITEQVERDILIASLSCGDTDLANLMRTNYETVMCLYPCTDPSLKPFYTQLSLAELGMAATRMFVDTANRTDQKTGMRTSQAVGNTDTTQQRVQQATALSFSKATSFQNFKRKSTSLNWSRSDSHAEASGLYRNTGFDIGYRKSTAHETGKMNADAVTRGRGTGDGLYVATSNSSSKAITGKRKPLPSELELGLVERLVVTETDSGNFLRAVSDQVVNKVRSIGQELKNIWTQAYADCTNPISCVGAFFSAVLNSIGVLNLGIISGVFDIITGAGEGYRTYIDGKIAKLVPVSFIFVSNKLPTLGGDINLGEYSCNVNATCGTGSEAACPVITSNTNCDECPPTPTDPMRVGAICPPQGGDIINSCCPLPECLPSSFGRSYRSAFASKVVISGSLAAGTFSIGGSITIEASHAFSGSFKQQSLCSCGNSSARTEAESKNYYKNCTVSKQQSANRAESKSQDVHDAERKSDSKKDTQSDLTSCEFGDSRSKGETHTGSQRIAHAEGQSAGQGTARKEFHSLAEGHFSRNGVSETKARMYSQAFTSLAGIRKRILAEIEERLLLLATLTLPAIRNANRFKAHSQVCIVDSQKARTRYTGRCGTRPQFVVSNRGLPVGSFGRNNV